jgi:hypothetical protein
MSIQPTSAGSTEPQVVDPMLPAWLELVRQQVSTLKFGSVLITVHDSRITQVERLEKFRLDNSNWTVPNET